MRSDFSLNESAIDLSNANPARGHKEVPRSTGHIVVTARYNTQTNRDKNRDDNLARSNHPKGRIPIRWRP